MRAPKRINLALQGGGAHGAFTWGVLDRLLEDERLEIAAISGTSAGALNAAALKAGWIEGGAKGARDNLDWLWGQVMGLSDTRVADWFAALAPPSDVFNAMLEMSAAYLAIDANTRATSPYSSPIVMENPLSRIVEQFQYDKVCAHDGPALFIGATNVRDGKIKIFQGDDICTLSILASACLPTLFRAVEIDGEAYWDGGYTGNPALFPLYEPEFPDDVVVVNINPLVRASLPRTAQQIANRINEISFNSSLLRELRAVRFVQRLLEQGQVQPGTMKRVLVHMISDDPLMNDLGVATKTIATPVVVSRLKAAGRAAADQFLTDHFDHIGEHCTVDLEKMFS
ncbi:patatin-like phospholipase family protein [Oceaniglobus ichthyenteri]|uniref:patatin-like phospholipase family protein n=1 Tax=Oceaniglobus ichthyenteri TaxID=2136177 RepID=UPI000D34D6A1|nr:patatin-like phospholipase family protein [Oceaniglobus ichthyenteri]